MSGRKKGLTQDQINQILFCEDTDESEISDLEEGEGWELSEADEEIDEEDTSVLFEEPTDVSVEVDILVDPVDYSKLVWVHDVKNEEMEHLPFDSPCGPVHSLPPGSNALEYFKILFSDAFCEIIRNNTNKYADFIAKMKGKVDAGWTPIESTQEIWGYIAIQFIMSIVKMPRLTDYWSSNPILGNEMVKKIMTRDRFFKIKKYFHVSDRENEKNSAEEDYSYGQKLEPLTTLLKANFLKSFHPYKEVSIDEALLKFKGRLGIVQYMPLKPAKRGLKFWMLCTSNFGYTLNFELYCGKKDGMKRSENGLGHDVVIHMAKSLQNPGHEIYFDRFFTSIPLMLNLMKMGHYSCGTLMNNRKHLPLDITKSKLKEQSDSKVSQCKDQPNLLCTTWMDKKQIYMLSTNSENDSTKVKRRKGSEKTEVNCPLTFAKYNQHMGGVDLADQRRKYYTASRKSKKWWTYVLSFLLDTAVSNAYILQLVTNMPMPKKEKSLYDFKLELIEELGKECSFRKRTSTAFTPTDEHVHKKRRIEGRKRTCLKCRKLGRRTPKNRGIESSWECSICQMCLCNTCF